MKTSQMGESNDASPAGLFDGPSLWALLFQGEMSSRRMVVGEIRTEEAFKVAVADYNDVIEALTSNRADQSFDVGVLPR